MYLVCLGGRLGARGSTVNSVFKKDKEQGMDGTSSFSYYFW